MLYLKRALVITLSALAINNAALAIQMNSADNGNCEEIGLINTFLESDFVKASVWPGVGPFQSKANDNHFVDPAGNQLTYSTLGKRINTCQLELHGGSNEAQSMLNLQMAVDFLLESLGVKPGQIHTVNTEVSKNNKLLTGNNYNPVQATIAPLVVSLQNLGINEGTENSQYRIVVANKDMPSDNAGNELTSNPNVVNSETAKESKASEETTKEENIEITTVPPSEEASKAAPVVAKANPSGKQWFQVEKNKSTSAPSTNKVEVVRGSQVTEQNTQASLGEPVENADETAHAEKEINKAANKTLSPAEQQKKDFQDVIQNWQRLKKTAVKERDVKILGQALAGKALIRQSDAIKWLVANHKYYDMTPGGAKIEKVTALTPGKKFVVFAEVKEKTKYMNETSGQIGKESDDIYKVNYTIEKIGEHWLIIDSALVKTSAEKSSADKTPKTTAKNRIK